MNPLEGRLIMISRLAAEGDELLSARAHVPLVVERDPAGKIALAMSLADVTPENRVDLLGRRCSCRCERVFSRIEPPCNCPRGTVALAGVMCALDGDVAMTNDRFEDLSLLAPEKLAQAIAHPSDRITDVRVLRRVEQIGKKGPGRGRSRSQATPVCLKPQAF
jgi:hypothetical protein